VYACETSCHFSVVICCRLMQELYIYIYIVIGISKLSWILIALCITTVHVILSFIVQTKEAK